MKSYKNQWVSLGGSDIAEIHFVCCEKGCKIDENGNCLKAGFVPFGGDGEFGAWIIRAGEPVPEHYREVKNLSSAAWIWFYDDERKTAVIRGGAKIYRAGEYGCLILLSENATIEEVKNVY